MTCKTTLPKKQVEFITCSGEFSVRSLLDMQAPRMLYDLQEADFSLKIFENFYELANNLRTNKNEMKARIALYCPSDLQFDIGKVLQSLASSRDSDLQLICFKNLNDAMDWISE